MAQQCECSEESADGDFLSIVAKDQEKWEAMVANMGCHPHLIPDVVQEMIDFSATVNIKTFSVRYIFFSH